MTFKFQDRYVSEIPKEAMNRFLERAEMSIQGKLGRVTRGLIAGLRVELQRGMDVEIKKFIKQRVIGSTTAPSFSMPILSPNLPTSPGWAPLSKGYNGSRRKSSVRSRRRRVGALLNPTTGIRGPKQYFGNVNKFFQLTYKRKAPLQPRSKLEAKAFARYEKRYAQRTGGGSAVPLGRFLTGERLSYSNRLGGPQFQVYTLENKLTRQVEVDHYRISFTPIKQEAMNALTAGKGMFETYLFGRSVSDSRTLQKLVNPKKYRPFLPQTVAWFLFNRVAMIQKDLSKISSEVRHIKATRETSKFVRGNLLRSL